MTTFTHRDGQHVEIDGARIYCECQGDPDAPALVLLHGGFGDIETFNAIAPGLGSAHWLIGIDSRGQGKSTLGTLPLTYRRIEQDVAAVLAHLGVQRCSVIGHSDGGIAALRLAASGTVRIDKLVTIGAHWTLEADDPTRALYAGVTAASWREMYPHSVERYRALNPEPDFQRLASALVAMWLASDPDGYPGETIARIACELLVIRGDEDPLVSRRHAAELADRVPGAHLANLPFAGHSPHEDKPAWVLALCDAFGA
ncbi:alpha/beta hydrolase [Stenotrophomonas sp. MMGLT7]|uniref:alpha/beta fold hydrolase n=1 Tax=Stenotrophomonas sp. MMGLT7 TaxID=2901227 RepID=UPI001E2E8ACF|nr:alpha/beta hydrolase [Stenotrophomonas sp. MMGLT7]MCD7097342.1 alpha/beta hydrolase [Stenotrophomonas sp. MMGLT7]